ncbi:tetratricopeptide repeat protein [Streptomyces sp. NPDC002643]
MREQTPSETQNDDNAESAAAEAGRPGAARTYAELLTEQGLVDEALPWWEKAAVEEGDADAARALAEVHRGRWEFEEAERWYRTAAQRDGGCAFGLASLLEEAGDTAGAEEWYARGAELGSLESLTQGAVLLALRGEWDEAQERLQDAYDRGHHDAGHTLNTIDNITSELYRWECALDDAEAEEDVEAAEEVMGELLDEENEEMFDCSPFMAREAEALCARAVALGSTSALVDQAVFVARDPARRPEARALAERAHELGYSGAAYVLGVWCEERGELREAERWYRAAAESDSGHDAAFANLGLLCERQHRFEEAERWLRRTGADENSDFDPWDSTEELVVRALKDIVEARNAPESPADRELREQLPELRAAAETEGPEEMFAYADALDRLHRLPEAAEWYRRIGTPRALLALGRMLHQRGGAKGAYLIPLYEPAAEEGDASAAYDIGEIHDPAEDRRAAGLWFLKAARLGHGRAAWALAWMAEQRGGDPQFAERWYLRAAESGLARPAYLAGVSMVRHGRHAQAEPCLRSAWDKGVAEASYQLGLAARALGRADEAVEWLRRAVERRADFTPEQDGLDMSRFDARPELIALLAESGRDEEATAVVTDLLEESPYHLVGNRLAVVLARRREDTETVERCLEKIAEWPQARKVGETLEEIQDFLRRVSHPH